MLTKKYNNNNEEDEDGKESCLKNKHPQYKSRQEIKTYTENKANPNKIKMLANGFLIDMGPKPK